MFHLRSASSNKTSSSSSPALFDVRLKTVHRDILIIKGNDYDAPSVYVSGNLVFSLPEKMSVKKISLKLIGTFKLDFMEVLTHHNRISASNPVKELKTLLQCDWNNLLCSSEGVIKVGNYGGDTPTSTLSKPRLKRPGAPTVFELPEPLIHRTPFENIQTPSDSNAYVLPEGNYELPFSCILPGNIPETIEGLQSGSVFYKFEASLEKSSSSLLKTNQLVKHKYIRIFRTLSSNDISLNEEVAIDNTWPGRVQYEVSIPRKAIPIGGSTPVKIFIVPLKKKLRLGKISATIIQHYVLKDSNEELYDHDQIIYESQLPAIPMDQLGEDRWDIHASILIPSDLKTVTQDCDLKNGLIKVRHKLKFKVQLVNEEDGHISELRLKLPINIYVSPSHKIVARNIELDQTGKVHIKPGGFPIFQNGRSGSQTPVGNRDVQSPSTDPAYDDTNAEEEPLEPIETENAPPMYEQHIYDLLYDALTGTTSPPTSPRPIIPRNVASSPSPFPSRDVEPGSYFDLTPGSSTPTHDLLNQYLSNQRTVRGPGVATPNIPEDEFISNIHSRPQTPGLHERLAQLDLNTLSRVPSYDEALRGRDDDDSDLAPVYEDDSDDNNKSKNTGSSSSSSQLSLVPPRPALMRANSGSPLGNGTSKDSRKKPSGSQSYFDVSRNNSSPDLNLLGLTRPSSVGNFSSLLQRRMAKKGVLHSGFRHEKS